MTTFHSGAPLLVAASRSVGPNGRFDPPAKSRRDRQIAEVVELIRSGRSVVLTAERNAGRTTALRAVLASLTAPVVTVSASESARSIPLGALAGLIEREPELSSTSRVAAAIGTLRGIGALVAVDDADLLDDESATVLLRLAMERTVLLTVNRPANVPDAIERIGRDHATTIDLVPIEYDEMLATVERLLGGLVEPGSLALLCEGVEGNPGSVLRRVDRARHEGVLREQHGVWACERHPSAADPSVSSGTKVETAIDVVGHRWRDNTRERVGQSVRRSAASDPGHIRLVGGARHEQTNEGALADADAALRRGAPDVAARRLAPLIAVCHPVGPQEALMVATLGWAFAWAGRAAPDLRREAEAGGGNATSQLADARAAAEGGNNAVARTLSLTVAETVEATDPVRVDALHLAGRIATDVATFRRIASIIERAPDDASRSIMATQLAHLRGLQQRDGRALELVAAHFQELGHLALSHEATAQAARAHQFTGALRCAGRCRSNAESMARNGVRPTFAARQAIGHLPILTQREQAVARLIAGGLTLREVADALGCAPRTAESHLQHAYVKLGINDRTALRELVGG